MELASVETGIGNNLKTKKGRVCSRAIEGHWKINENQGKWKPDRISIGRNRNEESHFKPSRTTSNPFEHIPPASTTLDPMDFGPDRFGPDRFGARWIWTRWIWTRLIWTRLVWTRLIWT